jgi:hypothetical protein
MKFTPRRQYTALVRIKTFTALYTLKNARPLSTFRGQRQSLYTMTKTLWHFVASVSCKKYSKRELQVFHSVHWRILYIYIIDQQMNIYKYVQSHIIIFHQHVSVTSMTTIRVSYNKTTIKIQIIVWKNMIKPLEDALTFL